MKQKLQTASRFEDGLWFWLEGTKCPTGLDTVKEIKFSEYRVAYLDRQLEIVKGIGWLIMKGIGLLIRKGIRILGAKDCFS